MQETIKILKVRFDKTDLKSATKLCMKWVNESEQRYITTPNPEILLEAAQNHKFRSTLNHSALNIADGTGILWASAFLDSTKYTKNKIVKLIKWTLSLIRIPFSRKSIRKVLPHRVTGVDLMESICRESEKTGNKIFLLGAMEGTAKKVKTILETKYPGIKVVGTYAGSPSKKEEKRIRELINSSDANILFVAYGAPKQEMWIARNQKHMPKVKLAAGIGGSFNFIAGIKKRAPLWMQKIGLEWLFRVVQEPSRIKRIYNATIKFSLTILRNS